MSKIFAEIRTALDAPGLFNDAIARGDMLPEHTYTKTSGGGRLAIDFHPADPKDRPDTDTFEITELLPTGGSDRIYGLTFRRGGHWYVNINRERDPAENGEVEAVYDGSARDGADNLVLADADMMSCRRLVAALHGAVRISMREACEDREADEGVAAMLLAEAAEINVQAQRLAAVPVEKRDAAILDEVARIGAHAQALAARIEAAVDA
jgi:hypothetical protein